MYIVESWKIVRLFHFKAGHAWWLLTDLVSNETGMVIFGTSEVFRALQIIAPDCFIALSQVKMQKSPMFQMRTWERQGLRLIGLRWPPHLHRPPTPGGIGCSALWMQRKGDALDVARGQCQQTERVCATFWSCGTLNWEHGNKNVFEKLVAAIKLCCFKCLGLRQVGKHDRGQMRPRREWAWTQCILESDFISIYVNLFDLN